MVKKCLMTIAVVALLATTVQAIENPIKADGWPFHWTVKYDELDICTFDVVLEVGYYVQIKRCGDLLLKLSQVQCDTIEADSFGHDGDFPCYRGCVKTRENGGDAYPGFDARANFDAVFGANFDHTAGDVDIIVKDGDDNDQYELNWGPGDNNQITGNGSYETLKLCMEAWNVELWNSGNGTGVVTVGTITISVKPPLANDSGDQDDSPW